MRFGRLGQPLLTDACHLLYKGWMLGLFSSEEEQAGSPNAHPTPRRMVSPLYVHKVRLQTGSLS